MSPVIIAFLFFVLLMCKLTKKKTKTVHNRLKKWMGARKLFIYIDDFLGWGGALISRKCPAVDALCMSLGVCSSCTFLRTNMILL